MKCPVCDRLCKNSNDLNAHLLILHKQQVDPVFVCEECGLKNLSFYGYLGHMRTHGLDKRGIYDKFHIKELEGTCAVCGLPTEFAPNCNKWGYHELCKDHDRARRNERRRKTTLELYGVENVGQLDEVKKKMVDTYEERTGYSHPLRNPETLLKNSATCMMKYGVPWVSQVESVKAKACDTFEQRYENGHPLRDPVIRKKSETTCLEKYGVSNPMQCKEISEGAHKKALDYFEKKIVDRFNKYDISLLGEYTGIRNKKIDFKCLKCDYEYSSTVHHDRFTPLCPRCYPSGRSQAEQEIIRFLTENDIKVESNTRLILPSKKELDIYLPDYQIAIEYNGLYWHSTYWNQDNNHFINKTIESKSLGITLLHFYADEWKDKKELVKSMILSRIGNVIKVGARNCKVVKNLNLDSFYEQNHIQGRPHSKLYNYALMLEDDIVCALSIAPSYISQETGWELARFATKQGCQVLGGFSKLMKYVREDFQGLLTTYADLRYSTGKLYEKYGFKYVSTSKPGYFYTSGNGRHNRMKFQKHKLSKLLPVFDSALSESQNMINNGYYRIYDCGQTKWQLIL